MLRVLIGVFFGVLAGTPLLLGAGTESWDFVRINQAAQTLYGPNSVATSRIQEWQQLLDQSQHLSDTEKLDAVNRFFNRKLSFQDDIDTWRVKDYWATPVEALYKGAADCEDFAIAKYFSLRQLGIATDKLRITYVKALTLNQAHMVLTYYAHPHADPLVLDNLINIIKPAGERTDLAPVYAFNAEGVWMPGQMGQPVSDTKRLSRWQDLLNKMRMEGFP